MYCKHCGQIIDGNSKFCSHCGKSQDLQNQVDNSINLRKRYSFRINKTAIADCIIAVFKEVLILIYIFSNVSGLRSYQAFNVIKFSLLVTL